MLTQWLFRPGPVPPTARGLLGVRDCTSPSVGEDRALQGGLVSDYRWAAHRGSAHDERRRVTGPGQTDWILPRLCRRSCSRWSAWKRAGPATASRQVSHPQASLNSRSRASFQMGIW